MCDLFVTLSVAVIQAVIDLPEKSMYTINCDQKPVKKNIWKSKKC